MAHTIGTITARASSTSNPITASIANLIGETVMAVLLKTVGATDRAGGALTWGEFTLTQASTTQKAAASPEAGAELWYLENPPAGTKTLTIPNTGAATIKYTVARGRAVAGGKSKFDAAAGANGTAVDPSPGSLTCSEAGDIVFAITAGGWTTWSPSAQAGTVIANTDDGADGGGEQYALRAAPGAFTLGWTFGTSDDWGAVAAAFKEVPPVSFNNYLSVKVGDGMSTGDKIR